MFVFVLFEKNTENGVCVRERHFYWWARDREVAREPESGCRALLPCPMAHARRHAGAVSCARATAARTAKSFPALTARRTAPPTAPRAPPTAAPPPGSHPAPLPPPEPPPTLHPAPLPPPEPPPPPDPGPLESDDDAWTPYHIPANPAKVTAPDAARTDGSGRLPTSPDPTTSDDAAPAKRRKRNPRPTPTDPAALSQPSLHRLFLTREPGPAAPPRAADEHTEHEPADPPDHWPTPV